MASEETDFSPAKETPSTGKLPHSYSSPAGVDSAVLDDDAVEAKQKSGKLLSINVVMLDDSNVTFHVQPKAFGQVLFDLVCKQLNLLEIDYFGLEYEDSNNIKYWLDCQKPLNRQIGLSLARCTLYFGVKFYTPDPAQLEEEFTRYLFCQQIKKDLANNLLQCNDNTAALMASYIIQADCGDYVPDDYPDHSYLSSCKFVPNQDEEMERRIMENHKKHVGQSPAQADLNLLETARRCELYGLRMHSAKDHEGVPLNLAVAHMGVLVFQNFTKINTFSWAKVRKLSFKRKRFLIKLHPEGYSSSCGEGSSSCQGYYKDTVEFFFDGRNECKNFWKKCVEHHGFFRCSQVKKSQRQRTRVLSRGSSFRYSGRTQKEVVEYVRENYIKREPFQRSQSFRHSSSVHSGIGWGGTSKSAQLLVPIRDHATGTPTSQSCGSMVLNDSCPSAESAPSSPISNNHNTSLTAEVFETAAEVTQRKSTEVEHDRDDEMVGIPEHIDKRGENRWTENDVFSGTLATSSPLSLRDNLSRDRFEGDDVSQDSYRLSETEHRSFDSPNKGVIGAGMVGGTELCKSDPDEPNSDNDINYTLHKRLLNGGINHLGIARTLSDGDQTVKLENNIVNSQMSRVMVEVDHSNRLSQCSPTLYARSRLKFDDTTSSSRKRALKSPKGHSLDFVYVHDLPATSSYSSRDDSINISSSLDRLTLKGKWVQPTRLNSSSSGSSILSHDSDYLEPLRIVEDSEDGKSYKADKSVIKVSENVTQIKDSVLDDDAEWDLLAPTFPPPPPPPLQEAEMEECLLVEHDTIEDARAKFLKSTILDLENADYNYRYSADDHNNSDASNGLTFEESSETTERTVIENESEMLEIMVETSQSSEVQFESKRISEIKISQLNMDIEVEEEEEEVDEDDDDEEDDDDDDDSCLPIEDTLLFPVRTLSRISERSTSEGVSDSKDSSPSQEGSRLSDDRHPSVGDLPCDSTTSSSSNSSKDNPGICYDHAEKCDIADNDSEGSPAQGRVPGKGSGLGLSPIRSFHATAIFENRYVLPDDAFQQDTYYMDIDPGQKKRLEMEGVFDAFEDTSSSTAEDTLKEDEALSLPEEELDAAVGQNIFSFPSDEISQSKSGSGHYEGFDVKIHVIPSQTPSPRRTPEPTSDSGGSSVGNSPSWRRNHCTSIQLQVSNGHIVRDSTQVENFLQTDAYDSVAVSTNEVDIDDSTQSQVQVTMSESVTLESVNSADSSSVIGKTIIEGEVDQRRKRYPTDKAYYISKEILATERTYKKDLKIILEFIQWIKDRMKNEMNIPDAIQSLQEMIEPIHEFHCSFVNDIEHRLATWEGFSNAHLKGDYQKIGDVLWNNLSCLTPYNEYLENYLSILEQLDSAFRLNRGFEAAYRDFETQKACYLPINNLLLKPIHRLLQYKLLLERLIRHYGPDHPDVGDCRIALQTVRSIWTKRIEDAKVGENFVKLVELQRDIVGIDDVIRPGRKFIREGCLLKLSKKGFQQRMFFLFSDALMYANRTATANLQFKIHGQVPLKQLTIEDCESRLGVNNCFSIFGIDKNMIVSASCLEEKEKWTEDLKRESIAANSSWKNDKSMSINSKSFSSSEEILDDNDVLMDNEELMQSPSRPLDKPTQQRSNTAVHVCWHRNTSVGIRDHIKAVENQLSGYLLRKFKNSSGWQKLWVVFTNFCLFFYKKFQDESPLASLPLLGYTASTPSDSDNINKEYVFKLQFKNHVYYFRAESEYSYGRWMEVVCSATQNSARLRLFSRTESVGEAY